MTALQIVWFKRDLRVDDHGPLNEALQRGPVLPLYVVEPELGSSPMPPSGSGCFAESLLELRRVLADLGQQLVRSGDVVAVLERAAVSSD